MMNIVLLLEYDGTSYRGWQRQGENDLTTIQGIIEKILGDLHGTKITLYGASRTDSGVHARGQVANFHTPLGIAPERWAAVLNSKLEAEIRVVRSFEVAESFHAQRDAVSKIYEYRLLNRKFASALDRRVYFYPRPLLWDRIGAALPVFVGEMDFRAFQGAKSARTSTVRKIVRFELSQEEPGLYRFVIEGNGFLKQMVRSIIGTVLEVGEGKRLAEDLESVIRSGRREFAGRTVPASGLCLVKVQYA